MQEGELSCESRFSSSTTSAAPPKARRLKSCVTFFRRFRQGTIDICAVRWIKSLASTFERARATNLDPERDDMTCASTKAFQGAANERLRSGVAAVGDDARLAQARAWSGYVASACLRRRTRNGDRHERTNVRCAVAQIGEPSIHVWYGIMKWIEGQTL